MTIQEKIQAVHGTPADVQQYANLAHNVPGVVACLVALLILLAGFGYWKKQIPYIYSWLFIVLSLGFAIYTPLSKGLANVPVIIEIIFSFPESYVHTIIMAAAVVGGIVELLFISKKIRGLFAMLTFPATFLVYGFVNILHPHPGPHVAHDPFFHSLLGIMFTMAGIFLIIERLSTSSKKLVVSLAAFFLFIAGYMLATYKEPPLAYSYNFPAPKVQQEKFLSLDKPAIIYILEDRVVPQHIMIKKGETVTFIAADDSLHLISSGPHPNHTDYPPLNIENLLKGEKVTIQFPEAKLYGFHDHLNETEKKLEGTILVVE